MMEYWINVYADGVLGGPWHDKSNCIVASWNALNPGPVLYRLHVRLKSPA